MQLEHTSALLPSANVNSIPFGASISSSINWYPQCQPCERCENARGKGDVSPSREELGWCQAYTLAPPRAARWAWLPRLPGYASSKDTIALLWPRQDWTEGLGSSAFLQARQRARVWQPTYPGPRGTSIHVIDCLAGLAFLSVVVRLA